MAVEGAVFGQPFEIGADRLEPVCNADAHFLPDNEQQLLGGFGAASQ